MSACEHPFAGEPVLVDREEALAILGVTEATFARFCREGRFENMGGRGGLWRSTELRKVVARRRRGGSRAAVTIDCRTQAERGGKSTVVLPRICSKFAPHKRKLVPPGRSSGEAFAALSSGQPIAAAAG